MSKWPMLEGEMEGNTEKSSEEPTLNLASIEPPFMYVSNNLFLLISLIRKISNLKGVLKTTQMSKVTN